MLPQKQTNLRLLKSLMKGFFIWMYFLIRNETGGRRAASWTISSSSLNVFLFCFFCISNFAGWWSHFVFSLSWLLGLSQSPTLKSLSVTKTKEEMELVSAEGNVYISLKKRPAMPWHAMCMSAHQYLNRRSLNRAKGSGLINCNDSLIQLRLQPARWSSYDHTKTAFTKGHEW